MKKVIADIDIHSSTPEWYWTRGLHDARILKKQYINRYEGGVSSRFTNCLEVIIDSKQAMFDTTVKSIRFYNYKELTPAVNITNAWWISDTLSYCNGKYVLEIAFRSMNHSSQYGIRFECCEVTH